MLAIFLILSNQLSAQEVEIAGTKYKVTKTETSLQYDNFAIRSETLKLPSHIHTSLIPKELNLGHSSGNCDDVCEGYASLAFDLQGKIVNAKGHSYQKFKELKNNKI